MQHFTNPPARPKIYEQLSSPVLVIGPAYCGKSELANRTLKANRRTLVIGTADLNEGLLAARVKELRAKRPDHWEHQDGLLELGSQLRQQAALYEQILVDSMNQWVANLILTQAQKYSLEQLQPLCEKATADFCSALAEISGKTHITMVTSEVGAGITPPKPVARLFRQLVSRINCRLADLSSSVVLVSAGIPLLIKGEWPIQDGPLVNAQLPPY